MRLTVLGKSPAWQDAGGACAGYLLEDAGTALLLDCGHGAFSKLRRFRDYSTVDAVVISHLHADHFIDLIPFGHGLTLPPRLRGPGRIRPRLLAPPGARDTFAQVTEACGLGSLIEDAFALEEYGEGSELRIGSLTITFCRVPHYVETFAIAVRAPGRRLVYGADSGPSPALVDFARRADLLLLEATLNEEDARAEAEAALRGGTERGHLTARESGEHARAAEARRLVLTHFTDDLEALTVRNAAAEAFGGPVELAGEGAVFAVAPGTAGA